jgi:hypothetical protein
MSREDVICMAREAGLSNDFGTLGYPYLPELIRFAALVAAAEREACAKLGAELSYVNPKKEVRTMLYNKAIADFEAAIRARGQG